LEPLQKPYLSVNGAHNLDTAIVPQESVIKINMSWQHWQQKLLKKKRKMAN